MIEEHQKHPRCFKIHHSVLKVKIVWSFSNLILGQAEHTELSHIKARTNRLAARVLGVGGNTSPHGA